MNIRDFFQIPNFQVYDLFLTIRQKKKRQLLDCLDNIAQIT